MTQISGGAVRTTQRPMPVVGSADVIRDLDLNKYLFWADTNWVDPTGAPVATSPFVQALPVLGPAQVGSSITCPSGSWAGFPAPTFAYQWNRDGIPISAATSASYTPVVSDAQRSLSCKVTASNSAGSQAYETASVRVAPQPALLTITPLALQAGAAPGTVVATIQNVATGTTYRLASNNGLFRLSDDGATVVTGNFKTGAGDYGLVMIVTPAGGGSSSQIPFTITASTGPATAPANLTAPSISGTARVSSTLTRVNGTWSGTAPITYTHQWFANGVAISGATAATYTPVTGDLGKTITVRTTATNSAGSATAASSATSAVAAAPAALGISGSPGGAAVGNPYSFTPTITGGTAPYTVSATGLPAGLSVTTTTTGATTGTPTTAGTSSSVVYTATDSAGASVSMTVSITVSASAPTGGTLDFSDPANSGLHPAL